MNLKMNKLKNFIKKYFYILLVVSAIFLLCVLEKNLYNFTLYFLEMIILEPSSAFYVCTLLIILLHFTLLKYVVSSMLFPCGYYFSNWMVTVGLYEDTLRILENDLNFIKKYKENYFLIKEPNSRLIELYEIKMKNFKKFENFLKQINLIYDDYEKNKISEINTQLLKEFQNLTFIHMQEKNLKIFSQIIDTYKSAVEKYREKFSRWEFKKLFNILKIRFQCYFSKNLEKINVDKSLYFYLLKPKKSEKSIPSVLVIFNNPNAMCAEFYSLNQNLMNLYLKNNITVLLWNYEGYGERKGNTTIRNIKSDSEKIMEYVTNKLQYTTIGVHGVSMGGISACHLAGKYHNISFLISDRTFSSLDKVIEYSMPCGGFLKYLYSFLYFENFNHKFANTNTVNYLNSRCKNKLLLYDSQDEIIPFESSLKYECTEYLFEKNIKKEFLQILQKNSLSLNNQENLSKNLIKFLFTNDELEKIKLRFFQIMRYYSNKKNNFLFDINRNNTESHENNINEVNKLNHEFLVNFFNNFLLHEHSYINISNIYENFDSYIKDFLTNLFVWGKPENQLAYDDEGKIFDSHLCKSHFTSVPILLLKFQKEVSIHIFNLENEIEVTDATVTQDINLMNYNYNSSRKKEDIIDIINHLNEFVEIFISKINLIFYKIYFVQENKNSRYYLNDADILKFHYNIEMINSQEIKSHIVESRKNVGYIINLSCGHNGEYSAKERREILNFINNINNQHLIEN